MKSRLQLLGLLTFGWFSCHPFKSLLTGPYLDVVAKVVRSGDVEVVDSEHKVFVTGIAWLDQVMIPLAGLVDRLNRSTLLGQGNRRDDCQQGRQDV